MYKWWSSSKLYLQFLCIIYHIDVPKINSNALESSQMDLKDAANRKTIDQETKQIKKKKKSQLTTKRICK